MDTTHSSIFDQNEDRDVVEAERVERELSWVKGKLDFTLKFDRY